jgi:hypothetical protein
VSVTKLVERERCCQRLVGTSFSYGDQCAKQEAPHRCIFLREYDRTSPGLESNLQDLHRVGAEYYMPVLVCYVRLVSDYRIDDRILISGRGKGFFLWLLRPDQF